MEISLYVTPEYYMDRIYKNYLTNGYQDYNKRPWLPPTPQPWTAPQVGTRILYFDVRITCFLYEVYAADMQHGTETNVFFNKSFKL